MALPLSTPPHGPAGRYVYGVIGDAQECVFSQIRVLTHTHTLSFTHTPQGWLNTEKSKEREAGKNSTLRTFKRCSLERV